MLEQTTEVLRTRAAEQRGERVVTGPSRGILRRISLRVVVVPAWAAGNIAHGRLGQDGHHADHRNLVAIVGTALASPTRTPVRSRRTSLPVVAVTGAAGSIGGPLVRLLSDHDGVRRVVALDDHRGETDGVTWRVLDVRNPLLAERLAGVDVVVHVDIDMSVDADPEARTSQCPGHANRRDRRRRGRRRPRGAAVQCDGVRRECGQPRAAARGLAAAGHARRSACSPTCSRSSASVRGAPRSHPGITVTMVRPAIIVGAGADTLLHPSLRGTPAAGAPRVTSTLAVLPC